MSKPSRHLRCVQRGPQRPEAVGVGLQDLRSAWLLPWCWWPWPYSGQTTFQVYRAHGEPLTFGMEQKIVGFEVDSATNQWWDRGQLPQLICGTVHGHSGELGAQAGPSASCFPCSPPGGREPRRLMKRPPAALFGRITHQFYPGIEKGRSWGELEGGWGEAGSSKLLYKWVVMAAAGYTLYVKKIIC